MIEESVSLWASMYSWFTPTVLFVFLNLMIGTIAITSSYAAPATTTKSNGQDQAHHHNHNQIQRSPSIIQRLKSINFSAYRSPEPNSGFEKSPDFSSNSGFQYQALDDNQQPASVGQNQPFLSRSPSILQKIKSFNLYSYISDGETSAVSGCDLGPSAKHQEADETVQTEQPMEVSSEEEEENSPTLDEVYSKLKGGQVNHVSRTKSDTEPAAGQVPPKLPRKMRKSASTKSPFAHFEENDVVEARRPATAREGQVSRLPTTEEDGQAAAADEGVDAKADDFINRFKQQLKLQRIDSITAYKEMVKRESGQ